MDSTNNNVVNTSEPTEVQFSSDLIKVTRFNKLTGGKTVFYRRSFKSSPPGSKGWAKQVYDIVKGFQPITTKDVSELLPECTSVSSVMTALVRNGYVVKSKTDGSRAVTYTVDKEYNGEPLPNLYKPKVKRLKYKLPIAQSNSAVPAVSTKAEVVSTLPPGIAVPVAKTTSPITAPSAVLVHKRVVVEHVVLIEGKEYTVSQARALVNSILDALVEVDKECK